MKSRRPKLKRLQMDSQTPEIHFVMLQTITSLPYRACFQTPADLAIVVGGYNSSNTSHLVELCEKELATYFVEGPDKLISEEEILHFDLHSNTGN